MDLEKYRAGCVKLRQKFGEQVYSREKLNDAWISFWKSESDEYFSNYVEKLLSLPIALSLVPETQTIERECPHESIGYKRTIGIVRPWEQEKPPADELTADDLLKKYGAKSMVEVFVKMTKGK